MEGKSRSELVLGVFSSFVSQALVRLDGGVLVIRSSSHTRGEACGPFPQFHSRS